MVATLPPLFTGDLKQKKGHTITLRIGLPTGKKLGLKSRSFFVDDLNVLEKSALTRRQFRYTALNRDWEFIFVASHDIAPLLQQGVIDVGITGSDYAQDYAAASSAHFLPLADLQFCVGTVHVLVPDQSPIQNASDLAGTTIATHLPNIARQWCAQQGLSNVTILSTHGTSEVYPSLGLAQATLDAVCTGETARLNGLRPLIPVCRTSAKLFTTEAALRRWRDEISELATQLRHCSSLNNRVHSPYNEPANVSARH